MCTLFQSPHIHFPSQKSKVQDLWSNLHFLCAASVEFKDDFIDAVRRFNVGKSNKEALIRPEAFRQVNGLLMDDWELVSKWLIQTTSEINLKALQKKLNWFRHRRQALMHIESAPDDVIHASLSMQFYP